jgi:internalin A
MSYEVAIRRIERAGSEKAKKLDLSGLGLEAVPSWLSQLTALQTLDLSNNQLKRVPDWLSQLTALQTLDLSRNQLIRMPDWLGPLTALQTLRLASNQLTSVFESLGQLKALQTLDLSNNQLKRVPDWYGQLTALQTLDLSNNQLKRVPDWYGQSTALQTLDLSRNQLIRMPDWLGQLTALQTLRLAFNQLTSVLESLGQLTALRTLFLNNNQLASVPESLGQLTALQSLDLSFNRLTGVPESLGRLTALQMLDLSSNQLTSVPESLGELTALETLHLSSNQLTSVPESLGELIALETLHLSDNQLTSAPESLGELTALQVLYLHGNDELGIPMEILGPAWHEIGNPSIKGGLSPARPKEILDYYFGLQTAARPLNEAKLMLIGWGAVGKTSLVNRLMIDRFDPAEKMTDGIRISNWKIRAGADDVRLNVWDFGGQEMNHGMHRFFLTPRSLYLVVVCGREGKEEQDAEYWLEFIKNFGGDSAALVILNKINELGFELNERNLKAKYPFIRGFIKTDCSDGRGLAELREAIARETDGLPEVRQSFPGDWVKLKNRVSGMKENYLTFEKYRELCREAGVTAESQQDSLAGALNRLGIALNFEHNPELQFAHILNPHWVTDGIYSILTSEKLKARGGVFEVTHLAGVLDRDVYPKEMRTFLVNLMKSFDLCFESGGAGRFLMPEHLSRQEPAAAEAFTPAECLNFQYRYPAYPPWLLPQFITRTHELSADGARWRSGVILSHDGCRALVKGDANDKTVSISVSGPPERLRGLLTVVRLHFDTLHMQKKLAPEQWVPLPDHPAEFIEYEELIGMEEAGELRFSKFIKGIGKIVVDVRRALQGIAARGMDRKELILMLNQIPPAMLDSLLRIVGVRDEFMSGKQAAQAERVNELIRLAEIPGGMGLPAVEEALNELLLRSTRPGERLTR